MARTEIGTRRILRQGQDNFFYVKGHHRLKATRNINTLVKMTGNVHSRLAMVCIILESVL